MSIVHRILFLVRIENQHGIKLQSLCVHDRKNHDSIRKDCLFEITFADRNESAKLSCNKLCLVRRTADNRNRIKSLLLPGAASPGGLFIQLSFGRKLHNLHFFSMPDNRFNQIRFKASMMQNLRCKLRNLHRVTVALFQDSKAVPILAAKQLPQLLPVCQSESKMNVLRHIAHDRIGTVLHAIFQNRICHHSIVLCLINHDMMRLTDNLRFLQTLIQISKCCQIIHIVCLLRNRNFISPFLLFQKEPLIKLKNRSIKDLFPKTAAVLFQNRFPFLFRVTQAVFQKLILDLNNQPLIQHIDLRLYGSIRLFYIIPDRLSTKKLHQIRRLWLAFPLIKHTGHAAFQALHELSAVKNDTFHADPLCFHLCTKLRQIPKPPISASVHTPLCSCSIFKNGVLLLIPVFIQEPHKKLFHRHLPDAIHVQIRQNPGNIFQQNPVTSYNIKVLRPEALCIIVKNKGNPVHGYGCLSGSGNTLYNDVVIRRFTDDVVLFLLDRRNNFTQNCLLIFRKILCQKLIIGNHFRVKVIEQLSVVNLISPFQIKTDWKFSAIRCTITAFSQSVFIIRIRYRRTPVHNHLMRRIFCNSSSADIQGFLLLKRLIQKINPSKIRLLCCLPVTHQGKLHMIPHRYRVTQLRVDFYIIVVIVLQHFLNLLTHLTDFALVIFHITLHNIQCLM